MATAAKTVEQACREAKDASHLLARASRDEKDACLRDLADRIEAGVEPLLEANRADVEAGREQGLNEALLDRLTLTEARIAEMAKGVREIADLDDPVGEVVEGWTLENGLEVEKKRVPIGVVAVVYEARPNVTIDAAALCLKSGNAAVLRGSSSAESSNGFPGWADRGWRWRPLSCRLHRFRCSPAVGMSSSRSWRRRRGWSI